MSKAVEIMSMSLDGFVADAEDGVAEVSIATPIQGRGPQGVALRDRT
jgi:hypothetical protein